MTRTRFLLRRRKRSATVQSMTTPSRAEVPPIIMAHMIPNADLLRHQRLASPQH